MCEKEAKYEQDPEMLSTYQGKVPVLSSPDLSLSGIVEDELNLTYDGLIRTLHSKGRQKLKQYIFVKHYFWIQKKEKSKSLDFQLFFTVPIQLLIQLRSATL